MMHLALLLVPLRRPDDEGQCLVNVARVRWAESLPGGYTRLHFSERDSVVVQEHLYDFGCLAALRAEEATQAPLGGAHE